MSDYLNFQVQYTVFDSVPTTVFTRTIPVTSFARVYVQATAVNPSNGDHRTFYRTVSIVRSAGSPSLSAAVDVHTPIGTAGSSAWNLTFALNGNDAQVQITGQNLATTKWMLNIDVAFTTNDP
jgi:hypothetical protein